MKTFKKRGIKVLFKLSKETFNSNKDNTIEISGLAVRANIEAMLGMSFAQMTIMGLPLDVIGRITVTRALTVLNEWQRNQVTLKLDDGSEIFSGDIVVALPDYNAAPNIPLMIQAQALYNVLLIPTQPKSFPGDTQVSFIMEQLAKEAGCFLVNHGVNKTLSNQSLNGDLLNMMRTVATAAKIDLYPDGHVIHIMEKGAPRRDVPVETLNRTNIVGYPTPIDFGCLVSCRYDPKYRIAARIDVDVPEMPIVNGKFRAYSARHRLDTETPQGQWFSDMKLNKWNG